MIFLWFVREIRKEIDKMEEYKFMSLLHILINKNGIDIILEEELKRKLYYYYCDPMYQELFPNFRSEDFFFNKQENTSQANFYHVSFDESDYLLLQKEFSPEVFLLIQRMAKEIALLFKMETYSKKKISFYRANPNLSYSLVSGVNLGNFIRAQLITDGDILSLHYPDPEFLVSHYFDDPTHMQQQVFLDSSKIVEVMIENASYVIKQGYYNEQLLYSEAFIDSSSFPKLDEIRNINESDNQDFELLLERPYVKRQIIK